MQITRESIKSRLDTLQKERQFILDNANAYNGAIQECERLLVLLDKEPVQDDPSDSDASAKEESSS